MQAKQLSNEQLLAQIEVLKQQLAQVNEEKGDLETLLDAITEHSTSLENEIHHKNREMLSYIHQVEKLTAAAVAVENNTFNPESLESVAARNDELGCLARVFAKMVQTIKTREQELATAKVQLEAILNTVPGSISWIDSKGIYISVNRHLAQQCQLSPDAFIGKEVGFLKDSTQFAQFIHQFLASPDESTSQVIEVPVRDGVRYYLIAAQKYQQGTGTVSVGIDITEQKQVEEALRIAEENYRSIYENALEGIFQSTPEGTYISVNPAMARIYGYDSPKDMVTSVKKISEQIYVDPTLRNQFQHIMEEQGEVKRFEYQAFQSDRNIIWVEENTRVVRDNSGKLLYYEGMIQDITDRKRKEAELKRQLAELQVEIDQQKREREVAKITQSDYFKDLQAEAEHFQIDEFWS